MRATTVVIDGYTVTLYQMAMSVECDQRTEHEAKESTRQRLLSGSNSDLHSVEPS